MSFTVRMNTLLDKKSGITYVFSHYYTKIKVESLPLENALILQNFITDTKSVVNKDQNHYHYNMFLEKYSYQLSIMTKFS